MLGITWVLFEFDVGLLGDSMCVQCGVYADFVMFLLGPMCYLIRLGVGFIWLLCWFQCEFYLCSSLFLVGFYVGWVCFFSSGFIWVRLGFYLVSMRVSRSVLCGF